MPGRPRRKDAAPEGRARSPPGSRRSSGHSGVLTHRAKVENPRVHGLEVSTRAWYCVSSNPGQRPGAPAGQQHVRPPGARRLAPSEQRPLQVDTAVTLLQPPFVFFAAVDKKTISCVFISSSDSRFQRVGVASVNLQSLANLQSLPVSVEWVNGLSAGLPVRAVGGLWTRRVSLQGKAGTRSQRGGCGWRGSPQTPCQWGRSQEGSPLLELLPDPSQE